MLILQYRSIRQLAFILALIVLLTSLGTISSCGKKSAPSTSPSSSKEEHNSEVCGPIESSPIAHQPLALARYRMLMKIEHQTGVSPLPDKTLGTRDDVLFPLGRSDKVYILSQGHNSTENGYPLVKLACYTLSGKGVKLLYCVELKIVRTPAKEKICVRNMLDYLSLLGYGADIYPSYSYVVPGNISKDAKQDLSLKQDLVDYSYQPVISVLFVHCFSSKTAESIDEPEHMQSFDVQGDNLAEQSQWYKKYGFPVADCELTVLNKKKKGK